MTGQGELLWRPRYPLARRPFVLCGRPSMTSFSASVSLASSSITFFCSRITDVHFFSNSPPNFFSTSVLRSASLRKVSMSRRSHLSQIIGNRLVTDGDTIKRISSWGNSYIRRLGLTAPRAAAATTPFSYCFPIWLVLLLSFAIWLSAFNSCNSAMEKVDIQYVYSSSYHSQIQDIFPIYISCKPFR